MFFNRVNLGLFALVFLVLLFTQSTSLHITATHSEAVPESIRL